MSVTLIETDAGGTPAYPHSANGNGINWTENIALAMQFADSTAANTFLSGKTALPTKLLTVSGIANYGKKTHT